MKLPIWIIVLLAFVFSISCTDKSSNQIESEADLASTDTLKNNQFELVNDCKNNSYKAVLSESIDLDSNAFFLTTTFKGGKQKIYNLDLPSGRAKIKNCFKDFIVISSACGGICYGFDFIFLYDDRAPEVYMNCNIADSNEHIISYVEDEIFEKIKIRNLYNGKEMMVELGNCENVPCLISKLELIGKKLLLKYDSWSGEPHSKTVNIAAILD